MEHINNKDIVLRITPHEKLLLMGCLSIALKSVKDENEATVKSKEDINRMLDVLRKVPW